MNIIEAIKSGKPFKRKCWTHPDYFTVDNDDLRYLMSGDRTVLSHISAILAEDWEIQEAMIQITESQFNETCRKVRNSSITSVTKIDEVIEEFKKELGF